MEAQSTAARPGYVWLISMVAAAGGLLFGFDTAIIAGAQVYIEKAFELDSTQLGFVVSSLLIGCVVGASIAGFASDRFGRKRMLLVAALLFAVSAGFAALPETLAPAGAPVGRAVVTGAGVVASVFGGAVRLDLPEVMWGFALGRFLGGLGIGIASMLSPLYIAEASPAEKRGSLVTLNQMAIITGILLAYVVAYALAGVGAANWRWMFASAGLPAVAFWFALLFVPESPRWLLKQGRGDEAVHVLTSVGGAAHAAAERREIEATIHEEAGSILQLLRPGLRVAVVIGVLLAIFQQITGINTILYFAPTIFLRAGVGNESSAILASTIVGLVNFAFTALAIFTIDRLGRKPLLLVGSGGMALALGVLGLVLRSEAPSTTLVLVAILAYVACFAIGLGPVVWLLMSEIYPTRIRGRAMSISTICLWAACFAVSLTFLDLVGAIGMAGAFWLYGGICVVNFFFVLLLVPETKGRTLEEIERSWTRGRG